MNGIGVFARRLSALLTLASVSLVASANLDGPAMKITATTSAGTGSWEIGFDAFQYDGKTDSFSWVSNGPTDIVSASGQVLATINAANAYYQQDPIIALGFLATAGNSAVNFTVDSALLSFATINPAQAQASAGTSLTDVNGDGASLSSTDGKLYRSYYNGFQNNVFAPLVGGSVAGPNDTVVTSQSVGFTGVGTGVSDMSAGWKFTLSANDMASGTSRYEVVPEPVSLAVFGLAALALKRRKKP